jgi:hypothetical protein
VGNITESVYSGGGQAFEGIPLRKNEERTLAAKASTPMTSGYRPELDVSVEVNLADGNHYQSLIGVL